MPGWTGYVVGGLAVLALIFMGWKAAGWKAEAMQLELAKLELRNELQRRVASDAARLDMQNQLTKAQEALAKKLGTTLKAIQDNVPKDTGCDIPDPVASQLQSLRSGQ